MAMRPRYGTGNQPRQLRQTYESFKPKSEWKYEDDATFLLVYLPGFVQERVKVVFTNVDNITLSVKVEGQRPLGGGRWSKFSELYRIPETCDIDKIASPFQRGVLTIIMPKIKIVEPKQEGLKSEVTSGAPQEIAETSALLERQGEEKQKSVEDLPSPNKKETTSEEKAEKGHDETSEKTASLIEDSKPEAAQKISSPQEVLAETSQKSVEAPSPDKKVTTSSEEKSQKGKNETSQRSAYEKVEEKSQVGHQVEDSPETEYEKKAVGISDGESAYTKADEKKQQPAEVEAAAVAQKTEDEKPKSDRIKEEDDLIAEKVSKDTKHESSASASEGLIEGKQLLMNMGAAALVIMGFGAYLSYTFL